MYHDLMDLYGDKGNIETLRYRASKRGINVVVDTCTLQEKRNIEDYDIFFLGGGADKEQTLIYKDLLARKESILKAKESGTAFLLICGGYQLFGQYYLDQDGQKIDGLGIYDYYTESSDRDHRCIGNIVVEANIHDKEVTVVGFENHGGQTKAVSNPFGKVLDMEIHTKVNMKVIWMHKQSQPTCMDHCYQKTQPSLMKSFFVV